jgi:hypothetical protein
MEGPMTTAPPPQPPPAQPPPPPAARTERAGFTVGDFLSFRYLITPPLVQVIYVLGAIFVTIAGLLAMVGTTGRPEVLSGLLIIVFGNLIWRVYLELVMLLFRINDGIQGIERNTRR